MRYWEECREFFGQFRDQYRNTGSILPSSRFLARALVKPMRRDRGARHILEVGPGTGAVTSTIVRLLRPGDRLDIVEINGRFVDYLRRRFDEEPGFREHRGQVRLMHGPLQEVPGRAVYDFMISGLPLNNFPIALVREVFASYERLLKPDGTLSYFEYLAIRDLKLPFVSAKDRKRLTVLGRFLARRIGRHQIGEDIVYMNVPPAVARHFRFGQGAPLSQVRDQECGRR